MFILEYRYVTFKKMVYIYINKTTMIKAIIVPLDNINMRNKIDKTA